MSSATTLAFVAVIFVMVIFFAFCVFLRIIAKRTEVTPETKRRMLRISTYGFIGGTIGVLAEITALFVPTLMWILYACVIIAAVAFIAIGLRSAKVI